MLVFAYTLTIFISASLLFLIQPMYAKMLLPLLGGAPAVWNTAMVFYQGALLGGYAYAHWLVTALPRRTQFVVHGVVLLTPFLMLPIGIPDSASPPTAGSPVGWLLVTMLATMSLPFFVVSATSPLLQRWFSYSGHQTAHDPYFLYAASNVGSFLALISYPLLMEPRLQLAVQGITWAYAYGALVLLIAVCGLFVWRRQTNGSSETVPEVSDEALTGARMARWVLLAFVPASMLMSVTNYITTDLLAMPLLWVIPLSIYLLSFSFVFARKPLIPQAFWRWMGPITLIALMIVIANLMRRPAEFYFLFHIVAFFFVSMFCHGEIAVDRPSARHLTKFFLLIAVGGVLGGMFNALVSPIAFNDLHEYPLTIILAGFLLPWTYLKARRLSADLLDYALPIAAGACMVAIHVFVPESRSPFLDVGKGLSLFTIKEVAIFAVPSVLALVSLRRPIRFGLCLAAIFLVGVFLWRSDPDLILRTRSFFGVVKVRNDAAFQSRSMLHGTTIHGVQATDQLYHKLPTSYYDRLGPVGDIFERLPNSEKAHIAVVGLGVGTIAAYGQYGQSITFYEIDPEVVRISQDTGWFTYLADTPAKLDIVLGDARLSLGKETRKFDLIILDAYSSDSVPIHLLTKEAMQVYESRLKEGGWILFNISNRFFDFEPAVRLLAESIGMHSIVGKDENSAEPGSTPGKLSSTWVLLTSTEGDLQWFLERRFWSKARKDPDVTLWTDDYSSVLQVLSR